MINNILFFSTIFLLKSILLEVIFDYSQSFFFPLELACLAIYHREYIWTDIIKWFFIGFTGFNSELEIVKSYSPFNWYSIYISCS